METAQLICEQLINEVRRRMIEESTPRIRKCVERLSEEQVWWRPNDESNSIGNLVLHLNGNVRQWVLAGVAGNPDTRRRQSEFDEQGPVPKEELLSTLESTMSEVDHALDSITADMLIEKRPVQTFEETVLAMLVHVTEHFSYHTGQIAWITKMLTEQQVGFYEGVVLE